MNDIPVFDFDEFKARFITTDFLPFKLDNGFKIFKIQEIITHLKFPLPLHRTNYYDILFVAKGSKSMKHCGLKKYEIQPANIFFKSAGQITSGDIFGNDVEGFFCLIDSDFLNKNLGSASKINEFPFFKYGTNPIVELNKTELKKFKFIFDIIFQLSESNSKINNNDVIIASYLNALLQEGSALHRLQSKSNLSNKISNAEILTAKFKDLVAEHYLTKRQVSDYAELLFVTANHLNKNIKSVSGKTASELISEMLLMEAKILLKQTNMNISEIAFYLRFQDSSYFTRFFKKNTRLTPLEYRKKE